MALGARTILKTRTDLAILGESVFEQGERWLQNFDPARARRVGLQNRLIVPSSYTRKYLLYHPSDLAMLGAAEDMAQYWSAPLDPRSGELLTVAAPDSAMAAVNLAGHPTESYLGLDSAGRSAGLSQARSSTAGRSTATCSRSSTTTGSTCSGSKTCRSPTRPAARGVRQMVTGAFWQRLFASDPLIERDLLEINPSQFALGALAGAA